MMRKEGEDTLHGDILERVLSFVPLFDLVSASHVSTTWQKAVEDTVQGWKTLRPWLIAHFQNPRNPSQVRTKAYDPQSRTWISIPHVPSSSFLHSSPCNFVYALSPSKLSVSMDAFGTSWKDVEAPRIWRSDPTIGMIGGNIIVVGGVCEFEEDSMAVEVYDSECGNWVTCQSIPLDFKGCAHAMWLSVCITDQKMYLMEKTSGNLCSFDSEKKAWGTTVELRPDPLLYFSLIRSTSDCLIVIGLIGSSEHPENLKIWSVDAENFECKEIGIMPIEMLKELAGEDYSLRSVEILTAGDFLYFYNPSTLNEIFFSEIKNGRICNWRKVENWHLEDKDRMSRVMLTCSKVGIKDVEAVFWQKNPKPESE